MSGWVGVDLDGTLAKYDRWMGAEVIGEPIPAMVKRVREWLNDDVEVRIMTARVFPLGTTADCTDRRTHQAMCALAAINEWCLKHIGQRLPVTCIKDYDMIELWDDRAITVTKNLGEPGFPAPRSIYV